MRLAACVQLAPAPLAAPPANHLRLAWAAGASESDAGAGRTAGSEGEESPAKKREAAGARPARVLVVEDEAIISMEIEMLLEEMGAEVVGTAMSALEAVNLAELHRPDLVTMDINIRGSRDGISAATEIWERFGIRSVFVSAYGDGETRDRAAKANPVGWISKPMSRGQLAAVLRNLPPKQPR